MFVKKNKKTSRGILTQICPFYFLQFTQNHLRNKYIYTYLTKTLGKSRLILAFERMIHASIFVVSFHHKRKNHEKINHRSHLFNRFS